MSQTNSIKDFPCQVSRTASWLSVVSPVALSKRPHGLLRAHAFVHTLSLVASTRWLCSPHMSRHIASLSPPPPPPNGLFLSTQPQEQVSATMQAALGASGVEGVFRRGCEHVMRVARRHSTTLSSLLHSVLLDPLVTWSPDRDQAGTKKVCCTSNIIHLHVAPLPRLRLCLCLQH